MLTTGIDTRVTTFVDSTHTSQVSYDPSTKTSTYTSPAGRIVQVTHDENGRAVAVAEPGVSNPLVYTYTTSGVLGQLASVTSRGTMSYDYGSEGYLSRASMPDGSSVSYPARNGLGLPLEQTVSDASGSTISTTWTDWDHMGNLTTVTTPNEQTHTQGVDFFNLLNRYSSPVVTSTASNQTTFVRNNDRQITQISRPGRSPVNFKYTGGRLDYRYVGSLAVGSTGTDWEYYATGVSGGGHVKTISGPGPITSVGSTLGFNSATTPTLTYGYNGHLVTSEAWSGPVTGSLSYGYDAYLKRTSEVLGAGSYSGLPLTVTFDADGLVTSATDGTYSLGVTYGGPNGRVSNVTSGVAAESLAYDAYGELANQTATISSSSLLSLDYSSTSDATAQRDAMGRIWQKKETVYGGESATTRALVYSYDGLGQLSQVTENGTIAEQYTYDPNGNRLTELGSATAATYDAQDRLLGYAQGDGTSWTFTYTDDGSLSSASSTASGETKTSQYVYDESGNLTQVTLADGTVLDYLVDGKGRRIGKKVNGTLTKQWLYDGQLRIVAELNGTTLKRFVYGPRSNTPELMLTYSGGSATPTAAYRIFSDHLGSPRYIANATDGSILFAAGYSAYGVRTVTSGEDDAIPFGFAGGLYDAQTRLTRFGARDYDARFGRWTNKDPILFDGGQTNLYVYVGNDPVNRWDPSGLEPATRPECFDLAKSSFYSCDEQCGRSGFWNSICSTFGFRTDEVLNCQAQCRAELRWQAHACELVGPPVPFEPNPSDPTGPENVPTECEDPDACVAQGW